MFQPFHKFNQMGCNPKSDMILKLKMLRFKSEGQALCKASMLGDIDNWISNKQISGVAILELGWLGMGSHPNPK